MRLEMAHLWILSALSAFTSFGCGGEETASNLRGEITQVGAEQSINPKIFVHGWGPDFLTNFGSFRRYFVKDGFPSEHIHEFRYAYRGDRERIIETSLRGFEKVFRLYGENTRFDVLAHSLGTIATMQTIMDAGISHRFRKYISIAGVDFGQNKKPFLSGLGRSDIYDFYYPYMSDYVVEFMEANASEIATLDKCSLYTKRDQFLNPQQANNYSDGVAVEVTGVGHINIIRKKSAYLAMIRHCFGGTVD